LRQSREVLFHKEGLTATVSVHKTLHDLILIINGKPDASAVGDLPEQDLLAHVPLLLHPEPRSALVIGLGSGITLGSAGLYPLERIDCAEISPEVIEACKFFEEYNYRILRDPRVRLIIADGRNHLALTDMKYDVIISEPSNPWIAGIADLFTREFFQLCYDRLTSQGVTCIWLEAYNIDEKAFRSIVRTFQSVFPNMEIWGTRATNYLLIGFKGQGRVDYQVLAGRMQQHAIAEGLKRIHVRSLPEFFGHLIMGSEGARKLAGDAPVHTDDNALLEFSTPRTMIANPGLLSLWEAIEWHRGADLSFLTGSDDKALAAVRQQIQRLIEARGHVVMGTVFAHRKQPEQALQELRKAVSLNRSDAALVELVDLVLAIAADFVVEKQFDRAIEVCQRVVDIDPENAKAHFQLGQLLMRRRQADKAFEHFLRAVQLEPEHAPYRFVLATAAYEMGKVDAAIDHYRQALRLKNDHAGAMNNLAWILASQPNSNPRDKDEAIKLAERACELTGRKDPKMLETLAAAYAGSGRFADAVAVAREAITLAEQANNQRLLQELRDRIELYGRQEPYRRAPRPGPK
jgi:spermidine synthase